MNPLLFTDVQLDADDSWGSFELIHGVTHESTYTALLARNLVPFWVPLFEFPREDNHEYLLSHWQVHQSTARLLGIAGYPDIGSADFQDEGQYQQWMALHAQIHAQEEAALAA